MATSISLDYHSPNSSQQPDQETLDRPIIPLQKPINWEYVAMIRQLTVAEKNQQAFAAASFALRQKRLILTQEHPDWSAEEVETVARRLVYGRHTVPVMP